MKHAPIRTGPEAVDAFEAKWRLLAALRREEEAEAEAAGIPWDDYSDVQEWRRNQITLGLGTGSYGGMHD